MAHACAFSCQDCTHYYPAAAQIGRITGHIAMLGQFSSKAEWVMICMHAQFMSGSGKGTSACTLLARPLWGLGMLHYHIDPAAKKWIWLYLSKQKNHL